MSATTATSMILDAALAYHDRGCWVTVCCDPTHEPGKCIVPRKYPCTSPGKAPINSGWQSKRLTANQIRELFTKHAGANVGIKWGAESGLIDVEADTPEAERVLQELLDESQFPELVLIPTYTSRRGYHRLFRWCEVLPKAVVKLFDIEFRCGGDGKGAQSVVPPSRHVSGQQYQWQEFLSLDDVDPPELPPYIVRLLRLNEGIEDE